MRSTASLSSGSPAPSPPAKGTRGRRGRGRGRGGVTGRKTHLAGLVAGDSDSSALTQESGDEGEAGAEGSRLGSVVTGTDGGTEEPEGEEEEEGAYSQCLIHAFLFIKVRIRQSQRKAGRRARKPQELLCGHVAHLCLQSLRRRRESVGRRPDMAIFVPV